MFEALIDITCFVTIFVSFIYGTRIAWGCGQSCQFNKTRESRVGFLLESIPSATLIYSFGFFITFGYFFDNLLTRTVFSMTSALILSVFIVSMTMPELKRTPRPKNLVLAELTDGSSHKIDKWTFNLFLANGRVTKFKRSDGWVIVGRDKLRKTSQPSSYAGIERREVA